jgi:hypothetical protein
MSLQLPVLAPQSRELVPIGLSPVDDSPCAWFVLARKLLRRTARLH